MLQLQKAQWKLPCIHAHCTHSRSRGIMGSCVVKGAVLFCKSTSPTADQPLDQLGRCALILAVWGCIMSMWPCVVYRFLGSGCYLRGHSHRFIHHNNTATTPKESYSCPIPQDPKGNLTLGIPLNLDFTQDSFPFLLPTLLKVNLT